MNKFDLPDSVYPQALKDLDRREDALRAKITGKSPNSEHKDLNSEILVIMEEQKRMRRESGTAMAIDKLDGSLIKVIYYTVQVDDKGQSWITVNFPYNLPFN